MNIIKLLKDKKIINPISYVDNTHYLVMMGSYAYGVTEDNSDIDVYGFCIPDKEIIYPHLSGEIFGFDRQVKRFDQWQLHHCKYLNKQYDFAIFNIVKYFRLCLDNNPNIIDSLFVPDNCVLYSTNVGKLVRENRNLFLHKGSFHKFKGYAFSQLHKMKIKNPEEGSKRYDDVKEFGFDRKFAYHIIRLLDEAEQILTLGTLNLQRNKEQLKAIRRGEWGEQDIYNYFTEKEKILEKMYAESTLRYSPDESKIKELLITCIEMGLK